MIETVELGAGSYPEAPEPEYKCYEFKATMYSKVKGTVWAKNEREALEEIHKIKEEDIDDIYDIEIDNVEEINEE